MDPFDDAEKASDIETPMDAVMPRATEPLQDEKRPHNDESPRDVPSLGLDGEAFSLQFEQASILHTDREVAVPLTPQYTSFKKLEVASSRRINQMTKLYNCVLLIALVLSAAVIIIARTAFSETFEDVPILLEDGTMRLLNLSVYTFPKYFTVVDSALAFAVFSISLLLLCVYCIVLIRGRSNVLNEQAWVIMLLVSAVVYLNPHEGIVRLRRDVFGAGAPIQENGFNYVDIFTTARMASFSVIYWLYLWMGAHSYRFLERRVSWRDWRFYFFKILIIAMYVMYKLFILFRYRVVFSEVPFATFIAFLHLYSNISLWPKVGVISVVVLTLLELGIAVMIAWDVRKSFTLLKRCDYTRHRTNILGYRFFLHQQVVFNTVYILTYAFLLFGLPIGIQTLQFFLSYDKSPGEGSYFDVQYAPFGLHLCLLAFIATEAYTNLPADVNVWHTICPCFAKTDDESSTSSTVAPEPVVYRNREPPSVPGSGAMLDIRPNCFVMQTNIQMFNLSWFVYYHGTTKERSLNVDFDAYNLKIRDCLYDPTTDTKAIVAESSDRIIFAFKGTSSSQNLVTDLKVNHRSLASIISNRSPSVLQRIRRQKTFRRAKIHAGFANAYNAIRQRVVDVTSTLMNEKKRPVCFTGHSLGGALATLSSMDVQVSLNIEGQKIAVSSFGSPRVGNDAFQELYDEMVPTHWRFVAGGDLISRLPKIGYRHVGKKVVLTSTGELFIDPSALEIIFWHSQSASIVHHRKACYLLALKSWCDNRGEYVPNLWPFPVSENDSRRFVTSFRKPISQVGVSTRFKKKDGTENRAARMQGYADAIDDLGGDLPDSPHQPMSQRSRELWRRLVGAALQDLKKESFHDTFEQGNQ